MRAVLAALTFCAAAAVAPPSADLVPPLAVRVAPAETHVAFASVQLALGDLQPRGQELVGDFEIRVPLFPARGDHGTVALHMEASPLITWILYPLGILASCFHLANGCWTAAITWGITISRGAQRRWGYVCAGLFALTFIAGLLALIAAARLDPFSVPLGPSPH